MIYTEEEIKDFITRLEEYNANEGWIVMEELLEEYLRILKERLG